MKHNLTTNNIPEVSSGSVNRILVYLWNVFLFPQNESNLFVKYHSNQGSGEIYTVSHGKFRVTQCEDLLWKSIRSTSGSLRRTVDQMYRRTKQRHCFSFPPPKNKEKNDLFFGDRSRYQSYVIKHQHQREEERKGRKGTHVPDASRKQQQGWKKFWLMDQES